MENVPPPFIALALPTLRYSSSMAMNQPQWYVYNLDLNSSVPTITRRPGFTGYDSSGLNSQTQSNVAVSFASFANQSSAAGPPPNASPLAFRPSGFPNPASASPCNSPYPNMFFYELDANGSPQIRSVPRALPLLPIFAESTPTLAAAVQPSTSSAANGAGAPQQQQQADTSTSGIQFAVNPPPTFDSLFTGAQPSRPAIRLIDSSLSFDTSGLSFDTSSQTQSNVAVSSASSANQSNVAGPPPSSLYSLAQPARNRGIIMSCDSSSSDSMSSDSTSSDSSFALLRPIEWYTNKAQQLKQQASRPPAATSFRKQPLKTEPLSQPPPPRSNVAGRFNHNPTQSSLLSWRVGNSVASGSNTTSSTSSFLSHISNSSRNSAAQEGRPSATQQSSSSLLYSHPRLSHNAARVQSCVSQQHQRPVHGSRSENTRPKLDQTECTICLCGLRADQTLRTLPCKHHFHFDCIGKWLKTKRICPLCRAQVCIEHDSKHESPSH